MYNIFVKGENKNGKRKGKNRMVLTVLTEKEIFGTGGGIVNFFDVFSKEEGPKDNIGCKKECSLNAGLCQVAGGKLL